MLEDGFSRYSVQRIVSAGDCIDILDVVGGESHKIEVLAAEDIDYALAPEERPQLVVPGPGFVYAPAVEGADAGFAYVVIEGNAVEKVPLVYGRTIEMQQEEEKSLFKKIFEKMQ